MSLQTLSTLTCLHCGTINTVTTSELPLGTLIGCSHCRRDLGQWCGAQLGFQPSLPIPAAVVSQAKGDTELSF
ncbi:hypothetical protein SAMN05216456_1189 [Devosia crocina]|uniref:Uncharacterized protein n=1 Tax=Devosia crocina TaxID=429728 RepID=A0A1I7N8I7_9HYPH|nr:hypothetical protein SAMN05216456_1189 [Devosia crocina]